MAQLKILFVCSDNSNQSPMAESVLKYWSRNKNLNWEVDSAGLTRRTVGNSPVPECIDVLKENGLTTEHVARALVLTDFDYYDHMLCMNKRHLRKLLELTDERVYNDKGAVIELLGIYNGRREDLIIHDPYNSEGIGGYQYMFAQITECCMNFIERHK